MSQTELKLLKEYGVVLPPTLCLEGMCASVFNEIRQGFHGLIMFPLTEEAQGVLDIMQRMRFEGHVPYCICSRTPSAACYKRARG